MSANAGMDGECRRVPMLASTVGQIVPGVYCAQLQFRIPTDISVPSSRVIALLAETENHTNSDNA
jgi:hypothetical protein